MCGVVSPGSRAEGLWEAFVPVPVLCEVQLQDLVQFIICELYLNYSPNVPLTCMLLACKRTWVPQISINMYIYMCVCVRARACLKKSPKPVAAQGYSTAQRAFV